MTFHHFLYGASRVGKTTVAAHCARAGLKTLAVTQEPGVTMAAFDAVGNGYSIWTPDTSEELFALIDYPTEWLAKKFPNQEFNLILFDNLQGLQNLLIGRPAEMSQEVGGISLPPKPATGIIGKIPKSAKGDESNPEALSQAQYGVLGRYSRRLLNGIDSLPFATLITSTEQYDFDEKYKKDAQGRTETAAAGRPRTVKGYPATEGSMTKQFLAACVSGAFIHLTRERGKYKMHLHPHVDEQQVQWFADPRGLGPGAPFDIDWTGQDAAELLGLKP